MSALAASGTLTAPLDLATLAAVRREVTSRANDCRSARRMHPSSGSCGRWDPRLVRAEELDALGRWLDECVADADHALALDERVRLTPAGLAALGQYVLDAER